MSFGVRMYKASLAMPNAFNRELIEELKMSIHYGWSRQGRVHNAPRLRISLPTMAAELRSS